MSRYILCEKCGGNRLDGERMIMGVSEIGEPAEYERIVWGIARIPTSQQRTVYVNGQPQGLPQDSYNCDTCGGTIKPGERCCARSIWTDAMPKVRPWENEYFAAPATEAASAVEEAKPRACNNVLCQLIGKHTAECEAASTSLEAKPDE